MYVMLTIHDIAELKHDNQVRILVQDFIDLYELWHYLMSSSFWQQVTDICKAWCRLRLCLSTSMTVNKTKRQNSLILNKNNAVFQSMTAFKKF
jgi:hypothetical protein